MSFRDVNDQARAGTLSRRPFADAAPFDAPGPAHPQGEREPILVTLSTVTRRETEFLWCPWIAVGKLSILAGRGGSGKTFIALDLAARVSRGLPFPGEAPSTVREPADVIYLTAEDDLEDTIAPRLDRLGADTARIHVLKGAKDPGEGAILHVTLRDLPVLEKVISKKRPRLLIVDPLLGFLGEDVDMNTSNQIRPVLDGIRHLTETYRCSALFIMHLRKAAGDCAVDRILGSADFVNVVRSVALAGIAPGSGERALLHVKSNIAAHAQGLAYRITGEGKDAHIDWTGPTNLTEEDLLAPKTPQRARTGGISPAPSKIVRAMDELRTFLKDGHRSSEDVSRHFSALGIGETTVRKAADAIGALRKRQSVKGGTPGQGGWCYFPPADGQTAATSLGGEQRALIALKEPQPAHGVPGRDQGACADTLLEARTDQDAERALKLSRNLDPQTGMDHCDQGARSPVAGPARAANAVD